MKNITRNAARIAALALCTLAIGTTTLRAQDTPPPPPQQDAGRPGGPGGRMNPERQLEMMTKALNLAPDQVAQIRTIQADSRKEMMALREDSATPQDQKREKIMAMRAASEAKVRAVLNDDQKPKYDAMQARMRDRMRDGRGGDGPPPPPQ
jgi:Spy/CpxP family protein refolding chaperone